jgi:predicted GIY-YIG superfamily endonuclease
MAVYCLMFERPIGDIGNPHGSAQTYIGYCADGRVSDRLSEHRSGRGATLTRYAHEMGIEYRTVFVIAGGTRAMERKMKQYKNTKKLIDQYERDPFGFVKRWKSKGA